MHHIWSILRLEVLNCMIEVQPSLKVQTVHQLWGYELWSMIVKASIRRVSTNFDNLRAWISSFSSQIISPNNFQETFNCSNDLITSKKLQTPKINFSRLKTKLHQFLDWLKWTFNPEKQFVQLNSESLFNCC